jgi:hypothetical protein
MNLSAGLTLVRRPSVSESALLEEWPQRQAATINQESPSKKPKVQKRVSFSGLSRCRSYTIDPSYEAAKSYISTDQKFFRQQAASEAFRIKYLIESCPMQTGPAIQQLLKGNILTCEELLGIENLVNKKPQQVKLNRRLYMEAVMRNNYHGAKILASVAAVMSSKSVEHAQMRALLAIGRV